ncbi:MAG: PEP/pyruvate-binding domain-containing protein [Pseudomonadales bacterium]|nr:PEP/pyruvate-binding domain-containing protein [Pseudomonadales bacterium]
MSDRTLTDKENGSVLVALGDDASTKLAVAGGKGASLGRLIKAGFSVPSGFVITTDAYAECLRANDLEAKIEQILAKLDYDNFDQLEQETAKIREAVAGCKLPDSLAGEIVGAYGGLGTEPYVAVRSSGTAEDLEGASFAGLYDTYLDVRGGDALLDAVLRCWASMWTARVVAYRQSRGFDHGDAGIAVVVQTMVEADVAGVMFIGNPMNARADEIVINASWGLGEAVVSGSITPDEYVVGRDTLEVKRRTLGSKELQVVRNPENGKGTVQEPVPGKLQNQHSLSDEQAGELAELGRRVTAYYEGLPQDTEWALSDGAFFLLQSRPVTGVEFTWEEDLDLWPDVPEDDEVIWTRAWADEVWTGPITPLMWSIRGAWMRHGAPINFKSFDMEDLADLRMYKYSQGTAYSDTRIDELIAKYMLPPELREPMLNRLHPSQIDAVMNAPFDIERCVKMFLRIEETEPSKGISDFIFTAMRRDPGVDISAIMRSAAKSFTFPTDEELQALGDDELRQRLEAANRTFYGIENGTWGHIHIWAPVLRTLLEGVLRYWYDGDNPNAYIELISGFPESTQQSRDDYDFWKLAETIRQSEKLSGLIEEFEGAAFFEELKNHEEGLAFLSKYDEFLEMNFYRGHADRDMYYPRRIEDPTIDYDALRHLSSMDGLVSPEEREEKLNQRREAATAEVVQNLEKKPMGALKLAIFNVLQKYCLTTLAGRDTSRPMSDIVTWQKKLFVREIGRRTVSRGLLAGENDYWFLSLDELCALLEGKEPLALAKAKIAGRRKGFERFLSHEEDPPMFLKGSVPMDLDQPADGDSEGVLKGLGTSPGTVTARARIIATQKDISLLEKGDILVCHGTDPGWTLAFSIVSGVVAQTGGAIAHFSCLSREYGIPAVSLPGAMKLIEDGSMITVNGSTGEVRLASE